MNLFDEYCQLKVDECRAWEVLGLTRTYWSDMKRRDDIPLNVYKSICNELQVPICDDNKTLSFSILEKLYE
jgi:hypothetical protein